MLSIGHDDDESISAEQSVLGSVFLYRECLNDISFLEPRDFANNRNRLIFEVMRWLDEQDLPVDVISVSNHFQQRNRLQEIGGIKYLTELSGAVPSAANVAYYAKLVRSQAIRRRGAETGRKIANLAHEDFDSDEEYFAAVEALVDELRPGQVVEMRSMADSKEAYYQHLKTKAEKMLSGFDQYDRWSQIWRGWLYVLAGRPSVGKTAKALQLALGIARQRREVNGVMRDMRDAGVVLFYSQEMPESRLKDRLISNISAISYNRIINKGGEEGFTEDEWQRIDRAYAELERLPIFIKDKPAITIEEIRADARKIKKKHGSIAAIFVDYLQIMSIPLKKGEKRHEAIGRVTGTAKQIARQMDCCFVMLSQMTRASEEREEPKLSDLKESGSIEQDADVVEFLWHDPDDVETGGKVIQSLFAKGRDTGVNKFRYLFQGWLQRYKELEKKEVVKTERKNNWQKNRK
jgi:replicative DNA helicase